MPMKYLMLMHKKKGLNEFVHAQTQAIHASIIYHYTISFIVYIICKVKLIAPIEEIVIYFSYLT